MNIFKNFSINKKPFFFDKGFSISGTVDLDDADEVASNLSWQAFLPLKQEPNVKEARIELIKTNDSKAADRPLFEAAKQAGVFDLLVKMAQESESFDLLFKMTKYSIEASASPIPAHLVNDASPNCAYWEVEYKNSQTGTFSVLWAFKPSQQFFAKEFSQSHKEVIPGFWKYFSQNSNVPSIRNTEQNMLNAMMDINNVHLVINEGYNFYTKIAINYSNRGKSCSIDLLTKCHGRVLNVIIKGTHLSKTKWDLSIERVGKNGSIYIGQLYSIFNKNMPIYERLIKKAEEALTENHFQKKSRSIGNAVTLFKEGKSFEDSFHILSDEFILDKVINIISILHEIRAANGAVLRFYWDYVINLNEQYPFSVKEGKLLFKNIRLSGVKYTFFADSEKLPELLMLLGDEFSFSKSKVKIKKEVINYADPFLALGELLYKLKNE